MTTNRTAALKIGVLLDGMDVPSWAYHMLQSVLDGEYASIEVLIIDERQIASGDAHHARLLSPLKILSQRWFDYFIERPNNGADACAPKSVAELLSTTPQCRIQTDNTTPRTHLPTPVIDQLNGLQLDVLVNINSRTLDGAVLGVSKHGVWSLLNRDNSQPRSGPPCFWETMQSWPVLSSGVSVVNRENPHGLLIYRSFAPVDRFSITTNINNLYWKSQAFIPRLLERLYQQGDAFYDTLHIDTVQPATEPLEFEQLKIEHRRSPRAGQGAGQRTPQQLLHQAEVSPTQHSTLVVKKTLEKLRWVFHNKGSFLGRPFRRASR